MMPIKQTLDAVGTVHPDIRDMYESELAKAYNCIELAIKIANSVHNTNSRDIL